MAKKETKKQEKSESPESKNRVGIDVKMPDKSCSDALSMES
jgi:hypothetical protein